MATIGEGVDTGGLGIPEEIPLTEPDTELAERVHLRPRLDPFGDEPAPRVVGEVGQPGHEGLASGVRVDPGHPRAVELHEVRLDGQDVAQAGEAGPGVVH